jgi:hypothetical protein
MLFKAVLAGILAMTVVDASPLQTRGDQDVLLGEIVHFKRDAVLEPRDLEMAEMHQVNLTESEFCHLMFATCTNDFLQCTSTQSSSEMTATILLSGLITGSLRMTSLMRVFSTNECRPTSMRTRTMTRARVATVIGAVNTTGKIGPAATRLTRAALWAFANGAGTTAGLSVSVKTLAVTVGEI